jgi:hypothetical protein
LDKVVYGWLGQHKTSLQLAADNSGLCFRSLLCRKFLSPAFCSPHDASAAISPSGEAGSLGHSCISSIATIASTISSSDCPALMGYLPLIDRRAIMIVSSILEESR